MGKTTETFLPQEPLKRILHASVGSFFISNAFGVFYSHAGAEEMNPDRKKETHEPSAVFLMSDHLGAGVCRVIHDTTGIQTSKSDQRTLPCVVPHGPTTCFLI